MRRGSGAAASAAAAAADSGGRPQRLLLALAVVTLMLASVCQAMGVVGIDYGTESMKVSLVKPGQPFDVVLSRDSKRKIPAAVAWKMQERMYGSDASSLATRFPGDTFVGAKFLLGKEYSDEAAKARQSALLGTKLKPNGLRNETTVALERATDYTKNQAGFDVYSVEEVVGMQLSHVKLLAEEQAGEEVIRTFPGTVGTYGGLDVAITVPIFFTAAERQSLYDAAGVAGMKPKLVSDGAAAAVNYAMTRTFPKPERHLFFDAGAGSTRATLIEFSTKTIQADSILSIKSTQKEAVVIDVLAAGWDREANGMALDVLIRDLLAQQFEKKNGIKLSKPLVQQPRAMARLLKEANRVKHILSANAEATSNIEGLADDIDFRGSLSRESLEKAVQKAGLTERFGQPAKDALAEAGLTLDDVSSVILFGGMTRVPLVQSALRAAGVPDTKIAQNVNADEAAVMGAAYYGASFNPQFRMKAIKANDGNVFPVVVREQGNKEEVIFNKGAVPVPSVTRKYPGVSEDFSFDIAYPSTVPDHRMAGQSRELYHVDVMDINRHLEDIKKEGNLGNVDVEVNVTITSQPLGTFHVQSAFLNVKQQNVGVVGALKNFFSVGAGNTLDDDDDEVDTAGNETSAEGASNTTVAKKPKRTLPTERHIAIMGRVVAKGSVHSMSGAELKDARDRLYVADVQARRKIQREEARNQLESFVYRARDLVDEEYFKKASKPAERDDIKHMTRELSEYMAGIDADRADVSALKVKRASLEALVSPIEKRITEQRVRGKAVRTFEKAEKQARDFLVEARANLTEAMQANMASKFAVSELDSFATQVDKDAAWFTEKKMAQDKRALDQDVVLPSDEVEKRAKKLQDTVKRFTKRRLPKSRPAKKADPKKQKEQEQEQPEAQKDKGEAEQSQAPKDSGDNTTTADGADKQDKDRPRHEEL